MMRAENHSKGFTNNFDTSVQVPRIKSTWKSGNNSKDKEQNIESDTFFQETLGNN